MIEILSSLTNVNALSFGCTGPRLNDRNGEGAPPRSQQQREAVALLTILDFYSVSVQRRSTRHRYPAEFGVLLLFSAASKSRHRPRLDIFFGHCVSRGSAKLWSRRLRDCLRGFWYNLRSELKFQLKT